MEFKDFAQYLLFILVAGFGGYVMKQISKMTDSVEKLNINLAVILEKMVQHAKILDKHEAEIENLKSRQQ